MATIIYNGVYLDINFGAGLTTVNSDGSWNSTTLFDNNITGPEGIAWDCTTQTLYGNNTSDYQTYTIDTNTGKWTALNVASGLSTPLADLTYNDRNSTLYGVNLSSGVYTIETSGASSGLWTQLGNSGLVNKFFTGLAYDCLQDKLYGVATDLDLTTPTLYTVNKTTGAWENPLVLSFPAMQTSTFVLEFDSVTNRLYGSEYYTKTTYIIDRFTGNLTTVGPTIIQDIKGIALLAETCCICVSEDTRLTLANVRTKAIRDVKNGDIIVNHIGQEVRVLGNVNSGREKSFICIERGALGRNKPNERLLIRRGHPLLIHGKEVFCETLLEMEQPGVSEISLDRGKDIHTLVTERKDFVMMNGVLVATWGREDFEVFKQLNNTKNFKLK